MTVETHSKYEILSGYIATVVSVVAGTISAAAVQALKGTIHDFELSAARGLLQGPILFVIGTLFGVDLSIKQKHIPSLIYVGLLYILYNFGFYRSNVYLPLAEAIGTMSVFAMIAAAKFVFRKDVTIFNILSLIICAIGILMVTQPCFLFHGGVQFIENLSPSNTSWNNTGFNESLSESLSTSRHCTSNVKQSIGYVMCISGGIALGLTFDVHAILLHNLRPVVKLTYSANVYFIASFRESH